MGQKFLIMSKTSKMPIDTQDILGPNVIVTLQSLLFANCAIFGISLRKIGNNFL